MFSGKLINMVFGYFFKYRKIYDAAQSSCVGSTWEEQREISSSSSSYPYNELLHPGKVPSEKRIKEAH